MKKYILYTVSIGVFFVFVISVSMISLDHHKWIAPPEADKLINPYKGNGAATSEGKKLYNLYCSICHGDLGKGDGIAGLALEPPPKDHTSKLVQDQSDGAIFWKLGEGRPPMASYRDALTEAQRWKLVNYIRVLGKNNN